MVKFLMDHTRQIMPEVSIGAEAGLWPTETNVHKKPTFLTAGTLLRPQKSTILV